jgi:hypothetical protein
MKWLGIHFPESLENELVNSKDILRKSVDLCEENWAELKRFASAKGIPIGCNIESIAVSRADDEASIDLLRKVRNV